MNERGDRQGDPAADDKDQASDSPQEDRKSRGEDSDEKEEGEDSGDKKQGDGTPIYKRPWAVLAGIVVLIAIVAAGVMYWLYVRSHETTDDAFIDTHATRMAPQVSGRVSALHIVDNQLVRAGDLLIEIDPRDYEARLAQARAQAATARSNAADAAAQVSVRLADAEQATANVQVAGAELANAEQDLARYRATDRRAVSRQQLDNAVATERTSRARRDAAVKAAAAAKAQIDAARAQVENAAASVAQADAQVAQAELQLSYTRVYATVSGRVTMRTVELGNYVQPGDQMFAIVEPAVWVTANFKETQLAHMKPGQAVDIDVDTYSSITFHGRVDSIQRGSGSYFSALPAQNATGNYVKVVQRIPVKIVFDDDRVGDYLLAPGMSVVPTVAVR